MKLYRWDAMPLEQVNDTLSRRLITGDRTMVAQLFIKKGGVVPLHHHENEQISMCFSGELEFELEGQKVLLKAGEVLHIPSNVPHKAVALTDFHGIDIFTPPRQDWLTGQDLYLRQK
jgi:quercetin dioxygenase-like cupin family protein